jgi:DNA polymerase epsilon subunit 1
MKLNKKKVFKGPNYTFDVRVETDLRQVCRQIQKLLQAFKEEKRGPTVIATQMSFDQQVIIPF